jgi:Beta-propeller repeat
VSKLSIPRKFVPAAWIVALAVLVTIGVAGVTGLRMHRGNASAKRTIQSPVLTAETSARVRASLEASPLAFEANQGQTDPQVKYMARGSGYTVFLTANDTVFALHSSSQASATRPSQNRGGTTQSVAQKNRTAAIHMHLVGGNPQSRITAGSQLPGRSNYFIGNDPSQWHANVAQYARISYRDAYPGVNMAFYGVQKQLEFDFIVAPGASPAPIRLGVSGANRIATDDSGNLILTSAAGDVLLHKPVAYQQKDGARQPVDARFVVQAHNQVSFELGNYDRSRELVVDPAVSYARYLGGVGEDDGNAIAVDGSGNAYVTGQTKSTNFPTKNPLPPGILAGGFDVFVTELSPTGTRIYSTYIGGASDDSGNAIAVDGSGDAFVAGGTKSLDFPTHGAFQSTFGGVLDAFVLELSPTGQTLTYSTFVGGSGTDVANGLALDKSGNAYIVGQTNSTSTTFPLKNPIVTETTGGFVTALSPNGSTLVYSTYLGKAFTDFASAVAVDATTGTAYVTGATNSPSFTTTPPVVQATCGTDTTCNGGLYDAFVSVIKPTGGSFVYSTFLGGESNDQGLGIAIDSAGDAYVTGVTSSTQFPLTKNLQAYGGSGDAFVAELNPTGTAPLIYSTYLGGTGSDRGLAIAVDGNKNAYVTGVTASSDFPAIGPTQPKIGGQNDAFVTEIGAGGSSYIFSTWLGGSLNENTATGSSGGGSLAGIAVDSGGSIYVTGSTSSTNFPTVSAVEGNTAGGTGDAFVAKFSPSGGPANFTVAAGALSPASGHAGVSATSTITVTSLNGFAGTVSLGCTVVPAISEAPTCSGTSVNVAANGTATGTLTVNTTAATALLEHPSSGIFYAMLMPVVGMALLGVGIGSAGSRRRKWFGFLMLGLLLFGLLLMPACGGSSSTTTHNPGTPTGPYTITVTGTSGQTVANGTPTLTLTVN